MKDSCVLVLVGKSSDPTALRGLAAVAREHSMHLSLLALGTIPPIPAYSYGVGQYGDAAAFSFYGNKNMTTAEGGMVLNLDRASRLSARDLPSLFSRLHRFSRSSCLL